jgi:hypothetical protein
LTGLDDIDRANVLAGLIMLREKGPQLPRPYADTLEGSKIPNMKELRIQSKGKPLRAFFAFDPLRQAVVLCAGNKAGDKRFYTRMIPIAEAEYQKHLDKLRDNNG